MRKFRTREARKREHRKLLLKTFLFTLIAAGVCAGLLYASQTPELRIQTVGATSDGALTKEMLETALTDELRGTIAGVIPKDSIFFTSTKHLETALASRFPRIQTVHVQRIGAYALQAVVTERIPNALWCGDVVPPIAYDYQNKDAEPSEEQWGTCYLMDSTGYIYAKAPIYTGDVLLRYYGPLEAAEPVGQRFIPEDEFLNWQDFYDQLRDERYALKALLFVDERDVELYLKGQLRILAPREGNTDLIRRRLAAVFTSDVLDPAKPIEYIDLRFGSKAYVRYVEPTGA